MRYVLKRVLRELYLSKVTKPLDLGTIRSHLQKGKYKNIIKLSNDIKLVYQNAMIFNPIGHTIHTLAKQILNEVEIEIININEKIIKDNEKKFLHSYSNCIQCNGESCNLCGEKCIKLESPVLLCHGPCMGRVKKNSIYYVSQDGMMLWCQRCFSGLPQVIVEAVPGLPSSSVNGDATSTGTGTGTGTGKEAITKKSLLKCKSDEEIYEPWVECDS